LLTFIACLLALLMAGLAYCMMNPVRWDGPGRYAAAALYFPLHLLVATPVAAVLAFVARRCRERLAAWVFGLVVILTAIMALTPTIAMWQRARELNVRLSLGNYIANAGHMNIGLPQPDRSVVYGTAKDGTKLELDVWRTGQPKTGPLRPAIVMVHGGAWTHGNRSSCRTGTGG
jgi:acetyl esterase/lipase